MTTNLQVAVGLVIRDGQILIARRAKHKHQGGKWEFPGGKIEPGESAIAALQRELKEEVNIEFRADQATLLGTLDHDYPEFRVTLLCYRIDQSTGTALGLEQQEIQWVSLDALGAVDFPDANQEILAWL